MYKGVEHSDTEDSDKSDSSDSEYGSDEDQKPKDSQDAAHDEDKQQESTKNKVKDQCSPSQDKEGKAERGVGSDSALGDATTKASDSQTKEKISKDTEKEKESSEKTLAPVSAPGPREKSQGKEETTHPMTVEDSDSERELVIDLGDEQEGKDKKRSRKDNNAVKESPAGKSEGESWSVDFLLIP